MHDIRRGLGGVRDPLLRLSYAGAWGVYANRVHKILQIAI